VRFKTAKWKQKGILAAAMALIGMGILIIALPTWVWLALFGTVLVAGAWLIYKNWL